MDTQFISIVERLAQEQGTNALLNLTRCKSLLNDYAKNEYKRERHLLLIAIETGAAKEITNATDLTIAKKIQVRTLKDDRFIDETAANEVIDLLGLVLRGNQSVSASARTQKTASHTKSKPQSTSTSGTFNNPIHNPPQPKQSIKKPLIVVALVLIFVIASTVGYVQYTEKRNIELSKAAYEAAHEKGLEAQKNSDHSKAIAFFDEAIKIEPNNSTVYVLRGFSYQRLGDNKKAIEDFTQAIKIDPNYAMAYSNRGIVYSELNDRQKAIADYTEAIRLDPNDANVYKVRGFSYGMLGDYKKAIADYTEAIRLDPNDANVYKVRGFSYGMLGDYKKAIADFTQAIRIDPKNAMAYNNRGWAYGQLGDHKQAVIDATKALGIDPNNAYAYHTRGYSHAQLGDHSKAIADYTQAIKIDVSLAEAYLDRGVSYKYLKDYKKATEDARSACDLGSCGLLQDLKKNNQIQD
ncbi:hypothetical protein FACS189487_06870 [Campylobacterota bacterium]|nr:hypothetical protein FACS189487_06870 [Campylobacterota bacterium]